MSSLFLEILRDNNGKKVDGTNCDILDAVSTSRSGRSSNYAWRGCQDRMQELRSRHEHLVLSLRRVHLRIDGKSIFGPSKQGRHNKHD